MPQQTTLLSFFSRTPKSSPSTSSGGSGNNGTTTTPNPDVADKSSRDRDDGQSPKPSGSTLRTPMVSTPVSRNGTGTKRRRTSGGDQSADLAASKKKLRNECSPSKEYSEGALVWAKLEGYPWWPAMIRGESRGGLCCRNGAMEFHVQFFDNPPSRAWVRKGDLKLYGGNQDADIPPAKLDKGWVAACKIADGAMSLDNVERLETHWYDFEPNENKDNNAESDEIEEMDVAHQETPKSSSRNRESKRHKRVLAIVSSSEDETEKDKKIENKKSILKIKGSKTRSMNSEDAEYAPTKNGTEEDEDDCSESPSQSSEESEGESANESGSEAEIKTKSSKRPSTSSAKNGRRNLNTSSLTPRRVEVKNRLQQFSTPNSFSDSPKPQTQTTVSAAVEDEGTTWTHMKLSWAKTGNRMDSHKRKESDPNYDSRTLFVPLQFLQSLTPAMRQWWVMKSKNFDTILFFKVGKFYEFYHWDACIAAEELGITYMRGEHAHSGFPEISFSRFANALVEKGYKIARIEQTETPDMLAERVKKTKPEKHEKVITREVCQISTKGVRYASFQDEARSNPFSSESSYLYAIAEKSATDGNEQAVFGVCFIDTTIGTFHIGQFSDDRHASRLRTLISHHVPAQILHERGKMSSNLQQLFHNMSGVRKDALIPDSEFWNAKKTLKFLAEQEYFRDAESGTPKWPSAFEDILSKSDGLGLTPDENWELGIKCLGGIIWYLKHCLLDHDLLSQQRFVIYKPVDSDNKSAVPSLPEQCSLPKYMVLDGITIRNLEILDGPLSLLSTLDKCGTNFGKRLLRHWLCLPLAAPMEISERQDAVEELMRIQECREKVIPLLKSLPDLERVLSKIHYLGSAHRSKNHPDGRAFFFEEIKYSKNKISDLLLTLRGFKTCSKIIQELINLEKELQSKLLKRTIERFPSLENLLNNFDNAFDHQTAAKEGKIKPRQGADEDYDNAKKAVTDIENEAEEYLKNVSRQLKTRATYFGSDKKRFQIEVPENVKVSKEFELSSSRKKFKRYYNATTRGFLSSIMKAEAEREEILRDITRRIFAQFDKHRDTWIVAVECIATLDVLTSLSIFSESQEKMCRPVVTLSSQPFINIVEGHHPCVASDTYIPNDTTMGVLNDTESSNGTFLILTGPNMGGKSTLMRQVGLLSILSHLGCFVPAEKCELSVVDRVFTRLGANDNIGEGESTFFVEMSETSSILKHGTANSLLLIDELGRGTATYDGTAIAFAVAKELSTRKCRSVFSTHYHTLVDALQSVPAIQMNHMACMVENENEDDPTQESITFLYKMISGPCPKSYGFNAARLAGISDDVIRVAHKKAKDLESVVAGIRSFTEICSRIKQRKFTMKDFETLRI